MLILGQCTEMVYGSMYPSLYYDLIDKDNAYFCETLGTIVFLSVAARSMVGDVDVSHFTFKEHRTREETML